MAFALSAQLTFSIAAGETRTFVTNPNANLTVGYAIVTSDAPVSGSAVFSSFSAEGRLLGEAGVPASSPTLQQTLIIDTRNGFKSGFALANPSSEAVEILLRLISRRGVEVSSTFKILGPGEQMATFIHELFPSAPPIAGTLQILCKTPLPAVALRFDPSLTLFTTLPSSPIQ